MNPQLDTGIRRTIDEIRQQAREPLPWHDITARSTNSAADQPRDGRQRSWALLAVAAVCALVLVGGLIAATTNRDRELEPTASPQAVTTLESLAEADWAPSVDRIAAVTTPGNPFEVPVGGSSGIRVGMPVVNSAGLVGKVISVTADRSVWMPLTDNRYAIGAKVELTDPAESAFPVAVEGQGSGQPLHLRFVDSAAASTFTVGDLVVTAGGPESLVPADIPIGSISASLESISPHTDLFEVTPNADLAAVDSVTILLYLPASAAPEPENTAPTYVDGQPVVPIDLLDIPPDYFATIDEAIQVLTRDCMEAQGFSYIFNPPSVGSERRPVVRDAEYRQAYGFRQPVPPAEPDRTEFTAQLDDPAWSAAWQGTDREGDGCSGEAIATVYPPEGLPQGPALSAFTEAVNTWRRDIVETPDPILELSPLFATANADWAACMTASGYSTTTPSEFANSVIAEQPNGSTATPSASEVSKALDDWNCQLSTNYVDRVYGYLQQSTEQFAAANAGLLDAANAEYLTTLERARQLVEPH